MKKSTTRSELRDSHLSRLIKDDTGSRNTEINFLTNVYIKTCLLLCLIYAQSDQKDWGNYL